MAKFPRHDCKTDDRKLAIDRPCSACSAGDSEMEHHDHCPPFREGVAAPLEPTQLGNEAIRIATKHGLRGIAPGRRTVDSRVLSAMLELGEFWAAAVSKNELAKYEKALNLTVREFLGMFDQREEFRAQIVELEKEIAALRETHNV